MDFKDVKLDDYCFNLELHNSMFFIDMLKNTYEFTLKGDEIEIFKKIKNGISEPITRKELIYSIQVEMAEKYEYRSSPYQAKKDIAISGNHNIVHLGSTIKDFRDPSKEKTEERKLRVHQWNVKLLIIMFYHLFATIDNIHKAIDNMVYLEKFLNKKEEPTDEEESSDEEESDEEESIDEKESRLNDKFNKMGWHGLHHPRGKFEDCGCTSCMNDSSSYHKSAHTRKLVDELKGEFDSLPYGRVKWEKLLKFQESSDEEESGEEEQIGPQKSLSVQQPEEQISQLKVNQNDEIERIRDLIQRYPTAAKALNNHH